jgi:hypothetical protein
MRSLSVLDESLHASATFHWACDNHGQFITISGHFIPILITITSLILLAYVYYM